MTPLKILLAMIAITAVVALPTTDMNTDTIVPEVRTLPANSHSFGGLRWPCALGRRAASTMC